MVLRKVILVFLGTVAISACGGKEAMFLVDIGTYSTCEEYNEKKKMMQAWIGFPEPYRELCMSAQLGKKRTQGGDWTDAMPLPADERYKELLRLLRTHPLQEGDIRNGNVLNCLQSFTAAARRELSLWPQTFIADASYFLDDSRRSSINSRIAGIIMNNAVLPVADSGNAVWEWHKEKSLREQAADLLVRAVEAAWPDETVSQDREHRFFAYTGALKMTTLPEKRAVLYAKGKPMMLAELRRHANGGDAALCWLVKWAPDREEQLAHFKEFITLYPKYVGWWLAQRITPDFPDFKTQQYVVSNLTQHLPGNDREGAELPVYIRGLFYSLYAKTGNEYWLDASFPVLLKFMPSLAPHKDYFLSETLLIRGKYAEGLKRRQAYLLAHYEDQYAPGAKPETQLYDRFSRGYTPSVLYSSIKSYANPSTQFQWYDKVLYHNYPFADDTWLFTYSSSPAQVLEVFERIALRCFARDRENGPPTTGERECVAKVIPTLKLREHILPKN